MRSREEIEKVAEETWATFHGNEQPGALSAQLLAIELLLDIRDLLQAPPQYTHDFKASFPSNL